MNTISITQTIQIHTHHAKPIVLTLIPTNTPHYGNVDCYRIMEHEK